MCAWGVSCCISSSKFPDIFVCPATLICLIKGDLQSVAKRKSFPSALAIIQYPPWKLFNEGETKRNAHLCHGEKKRQKKKYFCMLFVWFFTWRSLCSTAKLKCRSHSTFSGLASSSRLLKTVRPFYRGG